MNKYFRPMFAAGLTSVLLLAGCGKDTTEMDTYQANMESFFQTAADIHSRMNSISVTDEMSEEEHEQAYTDMLVCLDELNAAMQQMASYDVPEDFYLAESLADEAAENMMQADTLYHEVFTDDVYNQSKADGAHEYYSRANKRIGYIESILRGEVPDELEIVYEEDTDTTE